MRQRLEEITLGIGRGSSRVWKVMLGLEEVKLGLRRITLGLGR